MLLSLQIRGLAVVDEAELSLGPGLTVVTGETGAGKSLVVDALSLLVGSRAARDSVRSGRERAEVTGVFRLDACARKGVSDGGYGDADELLLRREIHRDGGGRAWVNGKLATAAILARLTEGLLDLHGQHEHQSLLAPARQLDLLDRFARIEDRVEAFAARVEVFRGRLRTRDDLAAAEADAPRRGEILRHHLDELEAASPRSGEHAELRGERTRLVSSARLAENAQAARAALAGEDDERGAIASVGEAITALRTAAAIDPSLGSFAGSLEDAMAQLDDVSRDLRRYGDGLDAAPTRLDQVEERLSTLERLARKHGVGPDDLAGRHAEIRVESEALDQVAARVAAADAQLAVDARWLSGESASLSEARSSAASSLADAVQAALTELAMADARARFQIRQTPDPTSLVAWGDGGLRLLATGCDTAEFLLSPNKGSEFVPLARSASGGELSRLMLAIKGVLAGADRVPVLVFDEVDAGVGGAVGAAVGRRLHELSRGRQVLCVTHLPQVASFADAHLRVVKTSDSEGTRAVVEALDSLSAREEELARMLSGLQVTDAARAQARELLRQRDGTKGRQPPGGRR